MFECDVFVLGEVVPILLPHLEDLGCRVDRKNSIDFVSGAKNYDLIFVDCAFPRIAREYISRIRSREREAAARGFDPVHIPVVSFGTGDFEVLEWGADDAILGEVTYAVLAQCLETWVPQTLTNLEGYLQWQSERSEKLLIS